VFFFLIANEDRPRSIVFQTFYLTPLNNFPEDNPSIIHVILLPLDLALDGQDIDKPREEEIDDDKRFDSVHQGHV